MMTGSSDIVSLSGCGMTQQTKKPEWLFAIRLSAET
jgi:hypothetical protein